MFFICSYFKMRLHARRKRAEDTIDIYATLGASDAAATATFYCGYVRDPWGNKLAIVFGG